MTVQDIQKQMSDDKLREYADKFYANLLYPSDKEEVKQAFVFGAKSIRDAFIRKIASEQ